MPRQSAKDMLDKGTDRVARAAMRVFRKIAKAQWAAAQRPLDDGGQSSATNPAADRGRERRRHPLAKPTQILNIGTGLPIQVIEAVIQRAQWIEPDPLGAQRAIQYLFETRDQRSTAVMPIKGVSRKNDLGQRQLTIKTPRIGDGLIECCFQL